MAEMKFIAIFNDADEVIERKVGFHSRDVLYYAATNNEEILAVTIVKQSVERVLYIKSTPKEFYREKVKAEDADMFFHNWN